MLKVKSSEPMSRTVWIAHRMIIVKVNFIFQIAFVKLRVIIVAVAYSMFNV
jgi:hypothetical protein